VAEAELAAVRPKGMLLRRIGMYAFGMLFFGLVPVVLVAPFGPPPGHPAYLVAWAVGAIASVFVMHRLIRRMLEACHLTLTEGRIILGWKSTTSVPIGDIVDTVPVYSGHKPFQKAFAAVNPQQFTVVLLRLRDGSRLPLSAPHHVHGYEKFLVKLFGLVGPTIRTQGELSAADLAVMGPRNANKLHRAIGGLPGRG
jgi:hypothetical protein